ncbi:disulfide bond formation protein B [Marinibactrum halimedae]|uniref:disulfide bond formation protein B n=1 Tax=Marinibactrum halimedae TaxID=1444977 RepID=UPI0022B7821E|nr:disulfide bond formation protein B [Marinibactrum halimedae]
MSANPLIPSIRLTNLVLFLGCTGLILIGLYMQHGMDLAPCALCITQRIFIIATGLLALIAFVFNPAQLGLRIFAGLGILMSIIGGGFSARHTYLQSLPPESQPACGPSLGYLIENFPLQDAFSVLLRGDGNCSEVAWTFLGISIPGWTIVAFAGLVIINLWQFFRTRSA